MKLVTVNDGAESVAGVLLEDDCVLCLARAANFTGIENHSAFLRIRSILENGLIPDVKRLLEEVDTADTIRRRMEQEEDIILQPATPLMPPIPDPSFILAQGMAYRNHLDEMKVPTPQEPAALFKVPSGLIGSGAPIVLPKNHADMVDYEGEFCAVVGKVCYRVEEKDVYDYIAGYTIMNDVSARDWVEAALNSDQAQMQAVLSWNKNVQGKHFPSFAPMGPCMVTRDEIEDPHELELSTRLNGELMQHTRIDDLIFRVEEFISYYSQWYKFLPGDVISTGTPGGVGYGRDPKVFMKDGDVIEVSVTRIGSLTNPVIRER